MPATCWSALRGRTARVTRMDDCCAPVAGTCAQVVTNGFISVEYETEIKEGEEIEVVRADGQLCISDKACDEVKWINITAEFCQVDPDLFTLITGGTTVVDYAGTATGNRVSQKVPCTRFSLELWSDIAGVACGTAANSKPYGYFLVPCMESGVLTGFTIENDGVTFTVTARSKAPSAWGTGPYNVVAADAQNTPGKLLTAIGADDHMHMEVVTVAPPAAQCGCQPLVLTP